MRKIKFLDTTLRDGEQSPGCSMHISEKLEVAEALDKLGVDVIEAGFPFMSKGDFEAVSEVSKVVKNAEVTGLARCRFEDIDACAQALKNAVCPRLHLFIATSPIHLKYKYDLSQDDVLELIQKAIKYARKYTDNIQFSFEDACRTPLDFLTKATRTAVSCGAKIINMPDTVGYITPSEIFDIFTHIKNNVENIDTVELSTHNHNDLGLACANTLSALSAGATQVEGTIIGIGERAGNAALEEVIMNIETRKNFYGFETSINTRRLYRTSTLVASVIGYKIPPNKAIVGSNAFAHEAGIHQHGVLKNKSTYEIMSPESIGILENKVLIGKHSGKHAFTSLLLDMGYDFSEEQITSYFEKFKALADRKKFISRRDVEAILPKVTRTTALHNYSLKNYEISAYRNSAFSEITLSVGDSLVTEKESGDGPVDASFKAINNIIGQDFTLLDFSIHSVTEGKDALGEASVKLELNGEAVSGQGVSTDVLEAAILAYINAANKLLGAIDEKA